MQNYVETHGRASFFVALSYFMTDLLFLSLKKSVVFFCKLYFSVVLLNSVCSPSARTIAGGKGVPPFGILIYDTPTIFFLQLF